MTYAKSSLHDLVEPGAHRWDDPNYKPLLNPSRVAAFKWCPRLHRIVYVKRLDAPGSFYNVPILQGSLYHEMARAVDAGDDIQLALVEAATKLKLSPLYDIRFSNTIDYLVQEMIDKWLPQYLTHIKEYNKRYETVALEKPFYHEFPTFRLITTPDKVVRDTNDGQIWVVERKTTSQDSSSWFTKWALNAQTTAEVVAVQKVLDMPVTGVYIEPVLVTRKRSARWSQDIPQPIHSFTHAPWRPVAKSPWLIGEWITYMEGVVEEMRWRDQANRSWEPNYTNCATCRMNPYCSGRRDWHDPIDGLVALEPDYVLEHLERERIGAGLSPTKLLQLSVSGGLDPGDLLVPDTESGTS